MNTAQRFVTIMMLYTGAVVVISQGWVDRVRIALRKTTGRFG